MAYWNSIKQIPREEQDKPVIKTTTTQKKSQEELVLEKQKLKEQQQKTIELQEKLLKDKIYGNNSSEKKTVQSQNKHSQLNQKVAIVDDEENIYERFNNDLVGTD